jgi:hypothetical protein
MNSRPGGIWLDGRLTQDPVNTRAADAMNAATDVLGPDVIAKKQWNI